MADPIQELAQRHGVSPDAVRALQEALRHGGGRQAQFSHPDLGGMGQWSAGGMTQIGDMFNTALKDRVNALATELSRQPVSSQPEPVKTGGDWWPGDLGRPSSTGSQNAMRYATFPDSHRVAIEQGGKVTVYDSGDHRISGVSQQQSGSQDLSFSSQHGTIRAANLRVAQPS